MHLPACCSCSQRKDIRDRNVYNVGATGHQYDLTVGYRNDLPLLGSIMQKVLDQIPQEKIDSWYGASASAGEIFTS